MDALPQLPKTIQSLSEKERQAIYNAIQSNNLDGLLWLEKLRKFISFHNRNLKRVSRLRFKEHSEAHLHWLRKIFFNQIQNDKKNLEDASLINALLIINTACKDSDRYISKINEILNNLEQKLIFTEAIPLKNYGNANSFNYSFSKWTSDNLRKVPVTIFCPSPFSLFSISVLQLLIYLNIPIKSVVILKFSPSRVKSELYRDGTSLFLKRVWRKLVLRSDENNENTPISLKSLKDTLASDISDIRELARTNNISCLSVKNFDECLSLEKSSQGEICIFTGGGLISSKILEYFTLGVINIHMGPLPQYKGMDVVEAPILDGCFDHIALTGHLMEPSLDAGPLISELNFSSDEYISLGELRNEMGAMMPILAVDSLISILLADPRLTFQQPVGQQYYFIHPGLREIISKVMLQRHTPSKANQANSRQEKLTLFTELLKDFSLLTAKY